MASDSFFVRIETWANQLQGERKVDRSKDLPTRGSSHLHVYHCPQACHTDTQPYYSHQTIVCVQIARWCCGCGAQPEACGEPSSQPHCSVADSCPK